MNGCCGLNIEVFVFQKMLCKTLFLEFNKWLDPWMPDRQSPAYCNDVP